MGRQAAGAIPEERADPLDKVRADPLSAEEREERGRHHVIEKAPFTSRKRVETL